MFHMMSFLTPGSSTSTVEKIVGTRRDGGLGDLPDFLAPKSRIVVPGERLSARRA
jgi:hypothetical protein